MRDTIFINWRKGHFKNWIDEIQGKLFINISDEILNKIREDCENDITFYNIRQSLRKDGLQKYYEHITQIYIILTGNKVQISDDDEKRLLEMYDKFIDELRLKYGGKSMSFMYMMKKIAEHLDISILNIEQNMNYKKLIRLDEMWENIIWSIDPDTIKRKESTIKMQSQWRMILAQRELQRLKISRELIYYPGIGIEYQKALADFNGLI